MEQQQNIPDFMKKYYQGTNYEGQDKLNNLSKQFEEERATFLQTTFVQKQQFQRDWNKLTGKNTVLTADEALKPMQSKYQDQAKEIATAHGYVEQENEQQRMSGQKQQSSSKKEEAPDREAFVEKLKAARAQAAQKQQQKAAPTTQQPQGPPQTERDKMLANLKAMHAENAQMIHRQRP